MATAPQVADSGGSHWAAPGVSALPKAVDFDGSWVVCDTRTGRLLVLNDSGRFIWDLHRRDLPRGVIADELSHTYDISLERARKDVDDLLDAWESLCAAADAPFAVPIETPAEPVATPSVSPLVQTGLPLQYIGLAGERFRLRFGDDALAHAIGTVVAYLELNLGEHTAPARQLDVWQHEGNYHIDAAGRRTHIGTLDGVLERLLFELVEAAYRSRDCLAVLHAGAVRCGDAAAVLVGARGSGKSTLIAGLSHRGYDYLSDDVCPLAADNAQLIPVPAPQAIKPGSWPVLEPLFPVLRRATAHRRFDRSVRYLVPTVAHRDIWRRTWPVGVLIFPRYQVDAAPCFQPLTPLQALRMLLDSGSLRGTDGVDGLLHWLEGRPAVSITYPDLDSGCALVAMACARGGGATDGDPRPLVDCDNPARRA